jgi:hypothetical protein
MKRSTVPRFVQSRLNSGLGLTLLLFASVPFAAAQTNTKTGVQAGGKITSGTNNTADGFESLGSNLTGSFNTAIGSSALKSTTASNNTAVGFQALFKNKTGGFNTAIGDGALLNNQTGSFNIAVGEDAGFRVRKGSNNIHIGSKGLASDSSRIRIGTPGVHKNTFIAGVIRGNGAGLNNLPASKIKGQISSSQIAPGAISGAVLASDLVLAGTTSGTFSGNINAPVLTSAVATISNENGSALFNPFPGSLGANLVGVLTGATNGAQLRFQKSGGSDFIDIGQNDGEDFVVEGNDVIRMVVQKGGLIGMGTESPNSRLHVNGDGSSPALRVQNTGSSKLIVAANGGTSIGALQDTPPANGLYVAGNVGFGTSAPAAKLDVRGDIKLGPSGQFQAAVGEEKLRIIRGSVNSAGTITKGSGFTVTKGLTGVYTINFSTPFSSAPSATATVNGSTGHVVGNFGTGATTTNYEVFVTNSGDSAANIGFDFIVIGPR